ncbi:TonB-dependent receptor plug domain-containing protein, partial [Parvibaculum sp.]|uniref:TonB-dependent receptor plug domain-containing protein n=1 Tax=Parvibaculum sp. TaxID=2024848 RepID=UPI002C2FA0C6
MRMSSRRARLLLGAALALVSPAPAFAAGATLLPPVDIESPEAASSTDLGDMPLTETAVSRLELLRKSLRTNDTASLFDGVAGVSTYKAGGVSSLPVVNGLNDERVRVVVDGMVMGSACPNHMNSPLSYVDPSNVGTAKVTAGITPVSMGGDSIAGTIVVDSPAPLFGASPDVSIVAATASTFYRSNGDGLSGSVSATAANDKVSVSYTGSGSRSGNYDGGGDDGEVHSSEYKSYNHALKLAARNGDNLVVLEAGQQYIPYEGYPNQWMDMTENRSTFVNARYEGGFDWGRLDARAWWRGVDHVMNFLDDKGG